VINFVPSYIRECKFEEALEVIDEKKEDCRLTLREVDLKYKKLKMDPTIHSIQLEETNITRLQTESTINKTMMLLKDLEQTVINAAKSCNYVFKKDRLSYKIKKFFRWLFYKEVENENENKNKTIVREDSCKTR